MGRWRRTFRYPVDGRTIAAMMVSTLALTLALLAPVAAAPDGCADVHIVGVRGSGQSSGFGEQVGRVVVGIEAALAARGITVTSEALDYPAISVSDSFGLVLLTGDYDRSVSAGVDALRTTLGTTAPSCRSPEFLLVGYSQGAQVIKTALADAEPTVPIAGVVLLADPTRDTTQKGIVRLGDPAIERDGAFGAIRLPHHVSAVAVDVCAVGDGVCERGRQSFAAHTDGYGDASQLAVPYLLAELDSRLRFSRLPR